MGHIPKRCNIEGKRLEYEVGQVEKQRKEQLAPVIIEGGEE